MTSLKFCVHCGRHYEIGTGVRSRCGDCGRAYDRELSRRKRARRARSSAGVAEGKKPRPGSVTATAVPSLWRDRSLEVHHRVALADGGDEFALSNLKRSAVLVMQTATGGGTPTETGVSHPSVQQSAS